MTGDGVNDGPALKVSNVGIAMVGGDGNEGARAVADIVIQDNELRTLLKAIALGRTTYANIRNAIHYLLATNMSEIELMLAASAAGLATPLNPMQLLWINLLTDVFPSLALAVEREHPGVLQSGPRSPDTPLFDRQGLKRLFGESLAITGPAFGAYAASLLRTGDVARAGTTAFTSLTLGQLGHAYLCRPPHAEGRNRALDAAVLGGGALQLATLALPPLRRLLGTTPLGFLDLALAAGGAAAGLAINRRRRHADETAPQTSGSD
jgi:Ca2+-transporting ATPase